MLEQWYPLTPAHTLQTEKQKLDGRNETDVVLDLMIVSVDIPVRGTSRHSGTRNHGLTGYAPHISFPITLKQNPLAITAA